MNRKPETKAAAKLLTQAFAAQGVKLGHQAALNLLATLEGFESFAHMKAVQPVAPVAAPSEPQEFVSYLVFGEEETEELGEARASGDEDALREALTAAKRFSFPTQEQLDSFLEGVKEACGWLSYENVDEDLASIPNSIKTPEYYILGSGIQA